MAGFGPAPLPHLSLVLAPADASLALESGTYSLAGQDAAFIYGNGAPGPLPHLALLSGFTDFVLVTNTPAPLPHLALLEGLGEAVVVITDTPASLPHLALMGGLGAQDVHIDLAQGTYSLSGQAMGFLRTEYVLPLGSGTYSLTGQVVILSSAFSGVGVSAPASLPHMSTLMEAHDYVLSLDTGIYSILGSDALADFAVTAASGTYTLAGQDLGLIRHARMSLDQGLYGLIGNDVEFLVAGNRSIALETGAYSTTGQDLTLLRHYPMPLGFGFYGLLGQAVTLTTGSTLLEYVIQLEEGYYEVVGSDVEFEVGEDDQGEDEDHHGGWDNPHAPQWPIFVRAVLKDDDDAVQSTAEVVAIPEPEPVDVMCVMVDDDDTVESRVFAQVTLLRGQIRRRLAVREPA